LLKKKNNKNMLLEKKIVTPRLSQKGVSEIFSIYT